MNRQIEELLDRLPFDPAESDIGVTIVHGKAEVTYSPEEWCQIKELLKGLSQIGRLEQNLEAAQRDIEAREKAIRPDPRDTERAMGLSTQGGEPQGFWELAASKFPPCDPAWSEDAIKQWLDNFVRFLGILKPLSYPKQKGGEYCELATTLRNESARCSDQGLLKLAMLLDEAADAIERLSCFSSEPQTKTTESLVKETETTGLEGELRELVLQSPDNEATAYPFWFIGEGKGRPKMVRGFWFSRDAAQKHLEARAYNYPKKAYVYCDSGHDSVHVKKLYDLLRSEPAAHAPKEGWVSDGLVLDQGCSYDRVDDDLSMGQLVRMSDGKRYSAISFGDGFLNPGDRIVVYRKPPAPTQEGEER